MSLLFILVAHLLVTLARLARPGGVRAVAAESLAVKHQLLIMNRSRLRSSNLTPWDRVIIGFCTLLVSPRRLGRIAVILKTSTLLRLHRALVKRKYWRANLRVLEVDEIKTISATPRSHAFVERLIGTIRREYLDRIWFWNQTDLERKLEDYKVFYNQYRCHTGLAGVTPAQRSGAPTPPLAHLDSYRWRPHCNGLFQTPTAA